MSEHDLQVTIFNWVELNKGKIPELANYFAIPNGGARHPAVGAKMKKEGVMKGVPDTFLAIPTNKYHGLFIEHKWGRNKLSEEQAIWRGKLVGWGYAHAVSYSLEETQKLLLNYIGA